jgi:hypothetical protein
LFSCAFIAAAGETSTSTDTKKPEKPTEFRDDVARCGERIGDVTATIVNINGTNAIKFEHELFDRLDNTRRHLLLLSIPGPSRRFVFVFNYSTEQEPGVRDAADTIIKSFKILDEVLATPESKSKWTRIALWTLGGLVAGLLLGMLLSVLTGKNQPAPSKT